jgi:CHAD domain-containing protein
MEANCTQAQADSWKNQITDLYTKMKHYSEQALTFEDDEDIHEARVNSRKLISLLKVMQSDEQQQKLLASLKKAHKLFGRIRDRDVLIDSFKNRREGQGDKKLRKLLKNFILVHKKERKQHRLKLKKRLPKLMNKRIDDQWEAFMNSWFAEQIGEERVIFYVQGLEEQFDDKRIHYEQWKQGKGMTHPLTLEALHNVRLLVKELRYLLTYTDFIHISGQNNKKQYYEELQESLGKINDRRVWLEHWIELDPKELGANPKDVQRFIGELNEELTIEIGRLHIEKPILN